MALWRLRHGNNQSMVPKKYGWFLSIGFPFNSQYNTHAGKCTCRAGASPGSMGSLQRKGLSVPEVSGEASCRRGSWKWDLSSGRYLQTGKTGRGRESGDFKAEILPAHLLQEDFQNYSTSHQSASFSSQLVTQTIGLNLWSQRPPIHSLPQVSFSSCVSLVPN